MSGSTWLGPEDLARELGIPSRTVYAWRSRSQGPRGYKIGKHVRFNREDVNAWLAEQADPRPAA